MTGELNDMRRGLRNQQPLHVSTDRGDPRRPFDGIHAPAWMDGSELCAQADPRIFHAEPGEHDKVAQAKEVCGACPLLEACFTFAMETDQRFGVWGGTSPEDRKRLRKRGAA